MLTCRELLDFLSDYASGDLPPDVRARFDEHLAVCPSCVAYVGHYTATARAARHAFDESAASFAPLALVSAILAARDAPRAVPDA